MLASVHSLIDSVGRRLAIPRQTIEQLKKFNEQHVFEVELDNGKSFKAYRVQHNNRRGPYKGGIRYHPSVSLEEIQTLAMLMSLKTAAVGIPMGGGKGGIAVDPRQLDKSELEELSRKYVRQLQPHIGSDKDVPAPDVNTDSQVIDWMVDEFNQLSGTKDLATFTGKSLSGGGSAGRVEATGRGGVLALSELLKLEGEPAGKDLTIAIQGFGNVGSYFGVIAERTQPGWKLIGASDSRAGVIDRTGLSAQQLQEYKRQGGRFEDYDQAGAAVVTNDDLISADVDVLVLAGLENSLTAKNMKHVRAKYIVEMANGPVSGEAHDYLTANGKIILPDIISNAGGVIVSYLEWLQNKNDERWDEAKVNRRLEELIKRAVNDMHASSKKHHVDLKHAAFTMAIERLTE